MSKLKAIEREFTATIADDEENWHVATASLKYINKLKKLGWIPISVKDEYSFFEVPRRCIGFRSIKPKKMAESTSAALLKSRLNSPGHNTESNRELKSKTHVPVPPVTKKEKNHGK